MQGLFLSQSWLLNGLVALQYLVSYGCRRGKAEGITDGEIHRFLLGNPGKEGLCAHMSRFPWTFLENCSIGRPGIIILFGVVACSVGCQCQTYSRNNVSWYNHQEIIQLHGIQKYSLLNDEAPCWSIFSLFNEEWGEFPFEKWDVPKET